MREKELRIYENQKKHIIQFTRRPRKPEIKKACITQKVKQKAYLKVITTMPTTKAMVNHLKRKQTKKKQRKE